MKYSTIAVNLSIVFNLTTISCPTVPVSETYLHRPIKGCYDNKLAKVEFSGIMNQSKTSAIVGANQIYCELFLILKYIIY
jgi:hypothetical protein